MAHWLFKSEPSAWSFEKLARLGAAGTDWSGVRNHTAKLNMQAMKVGEHAFFYHSNEGKDVVGVARVDRRLHLLLIHLPYHESDHVLNFAYNAICDGTCKQDIELRRQLENQTRAFGGDLAESRIGHLGQLGLLPCANPGAAGRLLVEQSHLAEELSLVQVCQHHFVAVLILDHDLDRARNDVVEDVR